MSFKPSSRVAAPLILASLGFFALHCSSDEGATNSGGGGTTSTSGAGGTGVAGSSAGMAGGGISSGGSAAGSSATAGNGGTGSPGGSGGAGGSGGSAAGGGGSGGTGTGGSGGSGGASGGSGGGGNGVTFAQVKDVLATSCKGSKCHDMGNEKNNIDLVTADGLYQRLTMPIPDNIQHCGGTTMVVPSNVAMSFLITAVAGPTNNKVTCKKGAGTEMIARMPDDCPDARPCLTADKIKILQDWVAAGAPQ
jgi:hypothetical protein